VKSPSWTPRSPASVAELKVSGIYDRTIIVVMGDHGESLGDHGEAAHVLHLNSVTHVPFMIRAPYDLMRGGKSRTPFDRWM